MEIKLNIDNNKLKEFGLDGIFKQALIQMNKMSPIVSQGMFFKPNKISELSYKGLNAEEALRELEFQEESNKSKQRYSREEIVSMQTNALLELRKEVMKIVDSLSATDLINFVRRYG